MSTPFPGRMDRRLAIKWMLAAGAGALLADSLLAGDPRAAGSSVGYGMDPDLMKAAKPGDYWPLTFSEAERRASAALCDVILPADALSPSASALGVPEFIDEWVSAPYPANVADRPTIVEGLSFLDAVSRTRFSAVFAEATGAQRVGLCEDLARNDGADALLQAGSRFFRRFRNLAMAGFYTTPVGMKDLGYVGNVPLVRFDGPPAALIEKLGLSDEVKW